MLRNNEPGNELNAKIKISNPNNDSYKLTVVLLKEGGGSFYPKPYPCKYNCPVNETESYTINRLYGDNGTWAIQVDGYYVSSGKKFDITETYPFEVSR